MDQFYVTDDIQRRLQRAVDSYESGELGVGARSAPDATWAPAVEDLRVTDGAQVDGRYPAKVVGYDARNNANADLGDCFAIDPNGNALAAGYYPGCRRWGEFRGLPVFTAAAGAAGDDVLVKVDGADTAAGYLDDKLTVGSNLTKTITSPGGDETLRLDVDFSAPITQDVTFEGDVTFTATSTITISLGDVFISYAPLTINNYLFALYYREGTYYDVWAADKNNYALTDVGLLVVKVNNIAGVTLTGIANGFDGRVLRVVVTRDSTGPLTLADESASSTATNRLYLPNSSSVILYPGEGCTLEWEHASAADRWRYADDYLLTTAYTRSLLDDPDAATARTTLGLGTAAVQNTGTSGANLPFLNGVNTWASAQVFSGAVTVNGTLTAGGNLVVNSGLYALVNGVTWGADQTDYAIADSTTGLAVTASANVALNSIASTAGRTIWITNYDATHTLTIKHEGAGTSTNRIHLPGGADVVLNQYESVGLYNDALGSARWQCFAIAKTPPSSAGYAVTSGTLAQFAPTTSAQLAGVISDETGSGALVFATSPTLVTPALGTPSSGNLGSCTGYPASALTGTLLASSVVTSSLTQVGVLASLAVTGSASNPAVFTVADGVTTGISNSIGLEHSTSGTAGAGFGVGIDINAEDAGGTIVDLADIDAFWATATHASRKGAMKATVADAAGTREGWRIGTDGSNPTIGFLGATPSAVLSNPDLGTLATTFGLASGVPTFDATHLTGLGLTVTSTATQVDQESASSTTLAVTPGRQQFHPSATKAWGYITVSGTTATLQRSYNCSISRTAVGKYTITFATAFSDTNYCWSGTAAIPGTTVGFMCEDTATPRTTTTLKVACVNTAGTAIEATSISFMVLGDQ